MRLRGKVSELKEANVGQEEEMEKMQSENAELERNLSYCQQ